MQTYTHYVITAILNRKLKDQKETLPDKETAQSTIPPVDSFPFLLGSIAPDLPLILIAIGFIASDLINRYILDPGAVVTPSNTGYLFEHLFFHNPWLKFAHNIFHAPILTILYLFIGYWLWKRGKKWGISLFWFGVSCTIHTAIDIPLHYDDGPLIFFPFDWETRFMSPVSYWDPQRYGVPFAIFEHILFLALSIYLLVDWWKRRGAKKAGNAV